MRYLTNTGEGSSKFWEGRVDGRSLIVRYGKIGTDGQSKTKAMRSAADAEAELAKLVREKLAKGYVDSKAAEGGTGGGASISGGSAGAFPFLFFGRRPGDWASGANMGHAYELRFRAPPSPKTRLAIAKVFESALADGPVRTSDKSEPWLWGGHWALFFVGERGSPDADAFFDGIEKALLAIHDVAPLGEVVFGGVRERGESDWDRWSYDQQEGPSWDPHFANYLRHPDTGYPEIQGAAPEEDSEDGESDAAFEKAREKAREGSSNGDQSKAGAQGKPKISVVDKSALPVEPALPASIARHFPDVLPPRTITTATGWTIALGSKPGTMNQQAHLLFFQTPDAPPKAAKLPKGYYLSLAVSPGADLAFVVDRATGARYEVTIPDGKARKVHSDEGRPIAASYLDRDHIAVLADSLAVLVRKGDVMEEMAKLPVDGLTGMGTANGLIFATGGDEKLRVISPAGGALKEIAKLPSRARIIIVHEGRVFLTDHRFPDQRTAYYEVQGLG